MAETTSTEIDHGLRRVLQSCKAAFDVKVFEDFDTGTDVLMDSLSVTPAMKAANRQYWGRQLGACWEALLRSVWAERSPFVRFPKPGDPIYPCDIVSEGLAIDAKYRIGSGDSGTLQKLARNAKTLVTSNLQPILLVLRDDSLKSAISAAKAGGWKVVEGEAAFEFVHVTLGHDILEFLRSEAHTSLG